MGEQPKCSVCGEPMPPGEEMFKFHGHSGDCPKPPLPRPVKRYYLDNDDDGHWYVVPLEQRATFNEWLTKDEAETPPGVVAIGGPPSGVTFTDFTLH